MAALHNIALGGHTFCALFFFDIVDPYKSL